jgi:hypothetical protein
MNALRVANVVLILVAAAGLSGCPGWGPHHGWHDDDHHRGGPGPYRQEASFDRQPCGDNPETSTPPCGRR